VEIEYMDHDVPPRRGVEPACQSDRDAAGDRQGRAQSPGAPGPCRRERPGEEHPGWNEDLGGLLDPGDPVDAAIGENDPETGEAGSQKR